MVQGRAERSASVGSSREWAEASAREWLQRRGFDDVVPTSPSEHASAALKGTDVMAQVKFSSHLVSRDEVGTLHAMLLATGRSKGFFFSVAGYTDEAQSWADQAGLVLLKFNLDAKPVNDVAHRWMTPGVSPTATAEQLKQGDRLADSDGGFRIVERVRTRKAGKLLHFIVEFRDGGEIELEMGERVKLYEPDK